MSRPCSRRSVLAGLCTLTLGALGGCLTRVGRTLPVTETAESVRGVPRGFDGMPDDAPFARVAVGDRRFVLRPNEKPHSVWLWNDSTTSRTIRLRLALDSGGVVFERTVTFPADGVFAVALLEAADYRLEVRNEAGGEVVAVDKSLFDCNDSATDVAVRADGSVDSRVISTTMGCGPLS